MRIPLRGLAEADELEQLRDARALRSVFAFRRIRSPYSTFCSAVMFGKRL